MRIAPIGFRLQWSLAVVLSLLVGDVTSARAQQDDKDIVIEQQRKQIEALKKENERLANEAAVLAKTHRELRLSLARVLLENAALLKAQKAAKDLLAEAEATAKLERDQLLEKLAEMAILQKAAVTQTDRLRLDMELLNKSIKEREFHVAKLDAEVRKYKADAITFEATAKARQMQNEALLEQIRALTLEVARMKLGEVQIAVDPKAPNPPAVHVNGKIARVDGDLIEINLGTDEGVNKNNTLYVYRLTPEPKYLGMIRIVQAGKHASVAHLLASGGSANRPMLKVGDNVASRLTPKDGPKKDDGK
jgi:hypothetical protein